MNIHDLAAEAASHWGASPLRLIRNRENAVFEVAMPERRAALRLHREGYQDDAAINSELWWCAALAKKGVSVPGALPAQDGRFLVTLSTGRKASVIEWVEGEALGEAGKPFDRPVEQIIAQHKSLGNLIAKFHSVTDDLVLPEDFIRPRWDKEGLVGENPFWGRFWQHPEATPAQRATLVAARKFLQDFLAAYTGKIGPIHADVLRENILVNDNSLSLIDFDDSGFGYRLYDLGTVLSQNLYEPAYAQIRDALMQGYGTADTRAVEIFTLARTCASVGWTMPRLEQGDEIHARHIARACMWAEKLFDRHAQS